MGEGAGCCAWLWGLSGQSIHLFWPLWHIACKHTAAYTQHYAHIHTNAAHIKIMSYTQCEEDTVLVACPVPGRSGHVEENQLGLLGLLHNDPIEPKSSVHAPHIWLVPEQKEGSPGNSIYHYYITTVPSIMFGTKTHNLSICLCTVRFSHHVETTAVFIHSLPPFQGAIMFCILFHILCMQWLLEVSSLVMVCQACIAAIFSSRLFWVCYYHHPLYHQWR